MISLLCFQNTVFGFGLGSVKTLDTGPEKSGESDQI